MDHYRMYLNGNRICPKCNGMLSRLGSTLTFKCYDCQTLFKCIEPGYVENEMIVEELPKKESL